MRNGNSKQSSPDSGIASSSNHRNAKKKGEISIPNLQQTLLIPKQAHLPPKPPRNVSGLSRDVAGLIWARKQLHLPSLLPNPPSLSQATLDAKPQDISRVLYPLHRNNLVTDVMSSTDATQDYADTMIGDTRSKFFALNDPQIICISDGFRCKFCSDDFT